MTTSPPLVTVGIPFFDESRHLAMAIRSVLTQTVTDLEVLLVDDGSTDDSLAIARSFRDPRVVVLSDGVRRRLPARLNQITRLARAPLVARMDADDIAHPERLARELAVLRAEPSCDAVGTWCAFVDDDDELFAIAETPERATTAPEVALERGLLAHATMVARRPWLLANPYDETLSRAEDRDLWCRTVRTSHLRTVEAPLYLVRVAARDGRFLSDYLDAQRQNRQLFVRYGRAMAGVGGSARLWLTSLAKSAVMRATVKAGLAERLVRRRGRPPTDAERAALREVLASARAADDLAQRA